MSDSGVADFSYVVWA
jgi:hypothetical protein